MKPPRHGVQRPEEAGQLRDVGGWALAVFLEFRYVADHNIAKTTPTPTAVTIKGRRAPKPCEASSEEFGRSMRGAMTCVKSALRLAHPGSKWPLPIVSPLIRAIPTDG